MREFLKRFSAKLPKREIKGEGGEPYLERYYLFHFGPLKKPWIVVYLHRFIGSDPDRGYHDHPWAWAFSLVLSGGYQEHVPLTRTRPLIRATPRGPGSLRVFGGDHRHRVVLLGGECWTLFVHGPWCKPWGFYRYVEVEPVSKLWPLPEYRVEYEEYASASSAGWWRP